jgi:hypothetical protein
MIDVIDFGLGWVCGWGIGFIVGRISLSGELKQCQTDVFIRDRMIDAAQRKLKKVTARDARGRFTGGK